MSNSSTWVQFKKQAPKLKESNETSSLINFSYTTDNGVTNGKLTERLQIVLYHEAITYRPYQLLASLLMNQRLGRLLESF